MVASEQEKKEYTEDEYLPPLPPDGGWGWVVVIGSLITNFIVDGVCFSFGIFYVAFLDEFHASKQKTAWVGSLIPGLYLGLGPVVSALANKFGCRIVTMIGSVVAAVAFILCTFSSDINVLIVTYGVIGGVGFGLMYLPSIVIVGYYFDKRRATATGIGVCGSGIGAFVFAPLATFLIQEYGWKGAQWIIAGIVLNGIVCGAVFRPLEARRIRKAREPEIIDPASVDRGTIIQKIMEAKQRDRTISTGSLNNVYITKNNDIVQAEVLEKDSSRRVDKTDPSGMIHNQLHHGIELTPSEAIAEGDSQFELGSQNALSAKPLNKNLLRVQGGSAQLRLRKISVTSAKDEDTQRVRLLTDDGDTSVVMSRESLKRELARPMVRQDIFYTGSVTSIAEYKQTSDMGSYVASVTSIPVVDERDIDTCQAKCAPLLTVLKEMVDFSLLKLPSFSVLCLTSVLAMCGFFTPFVYIVDYCITEIGTPMRTATLLLSILGLSNTIGRIVTGLISDQPWADALLIQNGALVVGGLATCLVPFIKSFIFAAIYCFVFGLCIAAFVALRSIVLVDILGLEKLSNSFGILLLFQGIAGLIGSPLAGMLYDATGSYVASFMSSGLMIAIGGLISLPLRKIKKCEQRHQFSISKNVEQPALIITEKESNM